MANPILPKHNNTAGVVPTAANLITNELAINTADAVAYVKHSDGTVKQIVDPTKVNKDSDTGAALLPVGTTAQRPAAGQGKLRFNTDLAIFEGYDGNTWTPLAITSGLASGATGGGNDAVFYNNNSIITNSYTIPTNQNSKSAGPLEFLSGVVITVLDNSVWTVI
jgi:hypothetical protein